MTKVIEVIKAEALDDLRQELSTAVGDAEQQASNAGGSAVASTQQADRAESEADRSETAAEVAAAAGRVYETSAAGQADSELVDGDYFWVVSAADSEVLELWRKGASSPTDTEKRTVSSDLVGQISRTADVAEASLVSNSIIDLLDGGEDAVVLLPEFGFLYKDIERTEFATEDGDPVNVWVDCASGHVFSTRMPPGTSYQLTAPTLRKDGVNTWLEFDGEFDGLRCSTQFDPLGGILTSVGSGKQTTWAISAEIDASQAERPLSTVAGTSSTGSFTGFRRSASGQEWFYRARGSIATEVRLSTSPGGLQRIRLYAQSYDENVSGFAGDILSDTNTTGQTSDVRDAYLLMQGEDGNGNRVSSSATKGKLFGVVMHQLRVGSETRQKIGALIRDPFGNIGLQRFNLTQAQQLNPWFEVFNLYFLGDSPSVITPLIGYMWQDLERTIPARFDGDPVAVMQSPTDPLLYAYTVQTESIPKLRLDGERYYVEVEDTEGDNQGYFLSRVTSDIIGSSENFTMMFAIRNQLDGLEAEHFVFNSNGSNRPAITLNAVGADDDVYIAQDGNHAQRRRVTCSEPDQLNSDIVVAASFRATEVVSYRNGNVFEVLEQNASSAPTTFVPLIFRGSSPASNTRFVGRFYGCAFANTGIPDGQVKELNRLLSKGIFQGQSPNVQSMWIGAPE